MIDNDVRWLAKINIKVLRFIWIWVNLESGKKVGLVN